MTKAAIIGLVCASLFAAVPSWAATLESPAPAATLSGIGFISGWKCDAGEITVRINDGGHIPVATGQPRADTRIACGTIDNGFITQINWNFLGTGTHTAVAYDDGVEFSRSTFTVVTTGEEYLPDAEGMCVVPDFPAPGENASFVWNTSTQHLELTDVGSHVPAPSGGLRHAFDGVWDFTLTYAGTCARRPPASFWLSIERSSILIAGQPVSGSFSVLDTGQIEGNISFAEGPHLVSVSGFLTGQGGTGQWFSFQTCVGQWSARKRTGSDPPPSPESGRAQLRKLLGTWRIFYGSPDAYDEWTFAGRMEATEDGSPVLVGTFDSLDRIDEVGVFLTGNPEYEYMAFYFDIYEDDLGNTCESVFLNLISPTRLSGRAYGAELYDDLTCGPIQGQGLPVTGERIRAPQ